MFDDEPFTLDDDVLIEFTKGENKYKEVVENWSGNSTSEDAAQKVIEESAWMLSRCRNAAFGSLRLFSSNESISDVKTEHLSLLLCDFYLARLYLLLVVKPKEQNGLMLDPEIRQQQLLKSMELLFNFMRRLRELEVLDKNTIQALENVTEVYLIAQNNNGESASLDEAKSIAETNSSKSKKMAAPISDPAALRTMKIERFKETRKAEKLLEEIQGKIKRAQDVEDTESADGLTREAKLMVLQNASRKALDEMDSILQEMEVVNHMKK
jgi:hypothetical protein